jgi:hypothetical protein
VTLVYIVVEGQTEESFVNKILAPVFYPRQLYLIPHLLGPRGHQGGNPKYIRVKKDVILHLKQYRKAYCSTMLDFYGLGKGFPGTPLPPGLSNIEKVRRIEQSMRADILQEIDEDLRPDIRFIPYLQLHEYEALLFSNPAAFARGIHQSELTPSFQAIRDEFPTPEDINDGSTTAPSKRITAIHPPYRKPLDGTSAALQVGLAAMRQECPHFRSWLEQLEAIATPQPVA